MSDLTATVVTATAFAAPVAGAKLKTSKFKVPGEGNSAGISVATVIVVIALWALVTNMHWVKPLFLPSPQAVFQQFYEYLTGQANDKPLWQHFTASMSRVFSAFFLACITAIPIGISIGDEPRHARHLRPAAGVLPSAAAAGLPAADH